LLVTYPGGVSPRLSLSGTSAAFVPLVFLGAFVTLVFLGAFVTLGAFEALTSFGALDDLGASDTLGALRAFASFGAFFFRVAFTFTACELNELPLLVVLTLEKRGHSVSKGLIQIFSASHQVYPALALQPLQSRSPPTIPVDPLASVRQISAMNKAAKACKRRKAFKGFIFNL
jgi:hypothetical protein